jgi:hypothetical protein
MPATERGAIAADPHAHDIRRSDAHARLEGKRAVDRGERVAAARVVLERHPGDVEIAAERGKRVRPVGIATHGATEARVTLEHVERADDPLGRGKRRRDARLCGAARMQGLRHRVHAEGLLEPGREGRDCRERVSEAERIEAEQLRRRGCRAKAADRPGVVPVSIVRAAHRGADAGGYLVAHDHPAQKGFPGRAPRMGQRERRGSSARRDRCCRGRFVDLDGVADLISAAAHVARRRARDGLAMVELHERALRRVAGGTWAGQRRRASRSGAAWCNTSGSSGCMRVRSANAAKCSTTCINSPTRRVPTRASRGAIYGGLK